VIDTTLRQWCDRCFAFTRTVITVYGDSVCGTCPEPVYDDEDDWLEVDE
jgi:hypothetical protein